MGENYQKKLEAMVAGFDHRPTLLLHSCCAPCSSYCMEYLREYFKITVFYYNPNITLEKEYRHRVEEEQRLIKEYNRQVEAYRKELLAGKSPEEINITNAGRALTPASETIEMIEGDYEPEKFFAIAKGYEQCPEGGERCFRCYELRLQATAQLAKARGFEFFTTTLTISPMKSAQKLNEIGEAVGQKIGVPFLPSDFKKKNGYKRSTELSAEYGLYRQDYCGCAFSKAEREKQKAEKEAQMEGSYA
ncbi:MAG: epoxyqueuosine reductase QueH [Lachnospiraceae bacterium]|nr:epoxyqueuosine reductase QueH [Lachnospiraceae bacterium]